jgi:aminopeptidase N
MPEWQIWNYYANDHLLRAYDLDSLKSSHPIEVPIDDPNEIGQIFDSISYCKGSAILRMVNDYVGEENFVLGLHNYLEKFKFKNATSDDLWTQLDLASSGKNVKNLMQVWTKEQGYPLVQVSRRNDPQTNQTILSFRQRRFLKNPERVENDGNNDAVWNIPISISTQSSFPNIHSKVLMNLRELEIDLGSNLSEEDWIKVNSNNMGFFLTKYSHEMFEQILKSLDKNGPNEFGSSLDRFGLLNESFFLCWCGELSAYDLMRLLSKFRYEKDANVWIIMLKNLHVLSKCFLNNSELLTKLRGFLVEFLTHVTDYLRFELNDTESKNY